MIVVHPAPLYSIVFEPLGHSFGRGCCQPGERRYVLEEDSGEYIGIGVPSCWSKGDH